MEYLREYSFQELLLDNNVVIIEPVRAELVERKPSSVSSKNKSHGAQFAGTAENKISNAERSDEKMTDNEGSSKSPKQSTLRKHFFYHPIRCVEIAVFLIIFYKRECGKKVEFSFCSHARK